MRRTPTRAALLAGLLAVLTACAAEQPAPAARATASPAPGVLTVTALGDSFTRGFSSCGRPGDCPTYSWATGTEPRVASLVQRLARARGATPVGHNLSVSGARVGGLARQARAAAATRADLVVVLVGVNDVCTRTTAEMTTPEDFRTRLDRALAVLDEGQPSTPLLLLSVPDLGRMADLGRGVRAARAVWDRHDICRPVFGRAEQDAAARAATDARRAAFDAALRDACATRPRCTWDDGAVGAHRFDAAFLSPDWFHPSAAGQRTLADLAEGPALRALAAGTAG